MTVLVARRTYARITADAAWPSRSPGNSIYTHPQAMTRLAGDHRSGAIGVCERRYGWTWMLPANIGIKARTLTLKSATSRRLSPTNVNSLQLLGGW